MNTRSEMRKTISFLLASLLAASPLVFSEDSDFLDETLFPKLTTVEIMEKTLDCAECVQWRVSGVCFWLKCSLFSCSVRESVKVEHFIPDLVVSVYTSASVWKDTRDFNEIPAAAIAERNDKPNKDTPLDFKHVDILVNPALAVFNEVLGSSEAFCQSGVNTLSFPFFLSGYDPNWRKPTIERLFPFSFLGYPKINTNLGVHGFGGYWAPEYPRCGWGAHPYDAINAAIAAHRATSIVTSSGLSPHIHYPVSLDCSGNVRCWGPEPVKANDNTYNRFQMLYPTHELNAKAFGGSAAWANGKSNNFETYLWALWRKFECCEKKGQAFLGSIDF